MKARQKKKHTVKEVGLALILTFIPIGMYAKVFLGNMYIGNMLMLIGFLLIFPFKNIFLYKKKIKWPSNFKWFASFFVLSFLYLFIYSASNISVEKEMLYLGVSLGTCIALVNTHYELDLKLDGVVLYTLILSLLCVVTGLFFCISGMHDIFIHQPDQLIYDDLTAGFISVINICCCLYILYENNRKVSLIYLLIFVVVIDIYHIILTGKRTPLIIGILCVLYGFFLYKGEKGAINIKKIYLFIAVFIVVLLVFANNDLYQLVIKLIDSIVKGIEDLIFGASLDMTNSTSIRYNSRKASLNDLSTYSIIEYIFGRGYMYRWMDIPLLQAYMDMGILGFILFLKNIIFVPFKCIVKKAVYNRKIMWATLICSYATFGALTTGTPYDHAKWIYLAVLLFILNGEKKVYIHN